MKSTLSDRYLSDLEQGVAGLSTLPTGKLANGQHAIQFDRPIDSANLEVIKTLPAAVTSLINEVRRLSAGK